MLTHFKHVLLSEILWTVAFKAPLSMEFSGQDYRSDLPRPPPGDLPDPGIKSTSLMSLALGGMFFTISTTWEAPLKRVVKLVNYIYMLKCIEMRLKVNSKMNQSLLMDV